MEHGVPLAAGLVLSATLAAGAAMRGLARRVPVPYTVLMMLLGVATGVVVRRYAAHVGEPPVEVFGGVSHFLSPDLILFVFLPPLIFESAVAIDVRAFRRDLPAVLVLAVPVMLSATALTAGFMWWLTGGSWGWSFAASLVFGALISATDPVAVVAVLRDLGAPKRLGILIEGESLLNDGTAIVAFGVLVAVLAGQSEGLDLGAVSLQFLRVALGGVLVGSVLGWAASAWIGATFNDPLVEITLTIALAYAAMGIAEGLLHVSGVMALVTAGLWMAGPGRTRISPEVQASLHHFWEMLAFLANTMIFYLVGVVVAVHLEGAAVSELALVFACFLGLLVIRAGLVFLARPLMSRLSDPVSNRTAAVMTWGGLRGAVSLALALLVAQHPSIDGELGSQILRLTAGVVLLTILVNGSTTGALLARLGFGDRSPTERIDALRAEKAVLRRVLDRLASSARAPGLRTLRFDEVASRVSEREASLDAEAEQLGQAFDKDGAQAQLEAMWRRALNIEQRTYWRANAQGTLGGTALRTLSAEVDRHRDRLREPRPTMPDDRLPPPSVRERVRRWARSAGSPFGARDVSALLLRYDLLRAVAAAAEEVRGELSRTGPAEVAAPIMKIYRGYGEAATRRLEGLRANLPEITSAIENRLAQRIALNVERDEFEALAARGAISPEAQESARRRIQAAMKHLGTERPHAELPETAEICRATPLFEGLPESTVEQLALATVEQLVLAGETLFRRGDTGDALYIIVRGAIEVLDHDEQTPIATLSTGDVLGEMALLGFTTRTATARARTSATVGRIDRQALGALDDTALVRIHRCFEAHQLDNAARLDPRLAHLGPEARLAWAETAERQTLEEDERLELPEGKWAFVCAGRLVPEHPEADAPTPDSLLAGPGEWCAAARAHVLLLDRPPQTATDHSGE